MVEPSDQIKDLKKQLSATEKELKEAKIKAEALQRNFEFSNSLCQKYQEDKDELKDKVQNLEDQLAKKHDSPVKADRLHKYEQRLQEKASEIRAKDDEIGELKSIVDGQSKELIELESQLDGLKSK